MVSRARRRGLSPFPGVSPQSTSFSPGGPSSSQFPSPPSHFLRFRCRQLAGRSLLLPGFKSKLPRGGVWGRAAAGEGMVCRGGVLCYSNSFSPVQEQQPVPCTQRRRGGQLGSWWWSGPCPRPAKPWVRGPDRGPKLARAAWAPRPRVSARSQVASFLAVVAFHSVVTYVWIGVCMCVRTGVR